MAQPAPVGMNGTASPSLGDEPQTILPGKRKRESDNDPMDEDADGSVQSPDETPATPYSWDDRDHKQLIQDFYQILQR